MAWVLALLVGILVGGLAVTWSVDRAWMAWFWFIDLPRSMDKPVDGEWLCGTRTGRIVSGREDSYMYKGTRGLSFTTTLRAWFRSRRYRTQEEK